MSSPLRAALAAFVLLTGLGPAGAQEGTRENPGGRQRGGEGGESGERGGEEGGAESELPAPLDGLFEAINLAQIQRRIDARLGRDTIRSDKPRAPELPLSVFVESIRPLGSLKYDNQLNYFVGTFTGSAPTLQTLTYEYVFADWNAARVEMIAPRGQVESFGFGYQRTLGVGANHNWAHGFLILPEVSVRGTGFVGGSAFYTAAWKPEEKSPWALGGSVGANRASFSTRPLSMPQGGAGTMMMRMPGTGDRMAMDQPEREEEARVWRTFTAVNFWYTFSPKLTVGLEADAYFHDRFGEYLVQPNLTWRPTKHFFAQFGAGWYEVAGHSQAAFMVRVNILNPSPRRGRD